MEIRYFHMDTRLIVGWWTLSADTILSYEQKNWIIFFMFEN